MCGLLGVIGGDPSQFSKNQFLQALSQLHHRGPDESGYCWQPGKHMVALGHHRLRIIDLNAHSAQPMYSQDGRYTIVFNGEIYNYLELKQGLLKEGYQFRTGSDTEVLLVCFERYGIECVSKLLGMFAFAIYDNISAELWMARDRLGIKPLYYQYKNESIYFASEVKGILPFMEDVPSLNLEAVSSYLSFRYPIMDDSFFQGIQSIPAGHYLNFSVKQKKIVIQEYWDVSGCIAAQSIDHGESVYLEQLDELLDSAVKYRMIADVPVGAYLSGGVDSSVVTALMSKFCNHSVKTYTIGFSEEGYSEFNYAKMVAKQYATDHCEVVLTGDEYLDTMMKLISFKDAPLAVPNEVPLYLMSKALSNDITVVLSGEGADEIFGGYGRIFRSADEYNMAVALHGQSKNSESQAFLRRLKNKYGRVVFENQVDHFLSIYSYTPFALKESLLSSDINLKGYENRFIQKFQSLFDRTGDASYANKMMYAFEKVHLCGLLNRVDITTMAASVEARVPFVDHRLVEFAFQLPEKYKLRWSGEAAKERSQYLVSEDVSEIYDTPKYLLKKAYESRLPHEVLYRKKMGFPVPLNRWLGVEFNQFAHDTLLSMKAVNRGIYNISSIKKILGSDELVKSHSLAMKVWMLVNLEIFCSRYLI